ncbi:MAG: SulP family inorganic anion transporter [Chloroflexi bacterium]|nr:SulP family inorganic anion transporter [Chloroflexota bacterium]
MENVSPFASPDLSFSEAVRIALQPAVLLRGFFASVIIWLVLATVTPSYARLIFNGKLAGYFAAGLAIALVSQMVVGVITALFSSDRSTVAVPQSPSAVVQGLLAASVIAAAPADMPEETLFSAVFLIIALSSVLSGVFVLLLGMARVGGFIRYIPYPIVGGFMAGLGWLMVNAGFIVAVDLRLTAESIGALMDGGAIARWLPSAAFGVFIVALLARVKSALIMPGTIIASLVLFYAWAYLVIGDVNALEEAGWFLPKVPEVIYWQLPDLSAIGQITPAMILASLGGIVITIVTGTLNVFFKASGQELVTDRELDFNHECTVNGLANIAGGVSGGGIVGYHIPSMTTVVETMSAYGRLAGVILAILFGLTILFGGTIYAVIPRFLPAGLLMFVGFLFLKQWLLDSWFKLPRQDYFTVALIALASAVYGLMAGIVLGLALATFFFVLEYSRMNVIKQELFGGVHRSNLDRSYAENQFLRIEGEKILILRLQGFVFFGSAYRFYERVKTLISDGESCQLAFIILDFKSVRGFDVSTINDFKKLKRLTDRHDIELLISSVRSHLQPLLLADGIVERKSGGPLLFDDLDHALEWAENKLLEGANVLATAQVTVEQQLAQHAVIDSHDVSALHRYLEVIETAVGDVVCHQGDESDAMYFIESGRVDVLLGGEGQDILRIRSMTAGTVIGEVGFYLKKARTASIVVTQAGVLQRLSLEALRQMEESDPRTASALHVFITRVLSDRLSTTNRVIQDLMD